MFVQQAPRMLPNSFGVARLQVHSGVNPFVWESLWIGRERGRRADEGGLNTDYEDTYRAGEVPWLEL